MEGAVSLLLAYLVGSFPTAYLVVKLLTGKDPREHGSRNVGGLNTLRIVGKERGKGIGFLAASLVTVVDMAKAPLAYILAGMLSPSMAFLAPMAAIFGHNYPPWLRFRGGRGLASLFGTFLLLNPALVIIFLIIQGVVYSFTRRFALGAILALLFTIPLYSFLGTVNPANVLAEFPVWLKYKEKYDLWRSGRLGVNM